MTPRNHLVIACVCALAAWTPLAGAQEQPPRYSAKVPPSITTPDRAETALLGTLSFRDGMPSAETAEKALDFLTVSRGVEAFLSGLSATSVQGMMDGYKSIGANPGDLVVTEDFMDARSLFLTPNTSTIYGSAELNVSDGPIVLVVPPRVLGPVMDGMQHYLTDVGFVGPDQGKGGRYLFVRADYEGPIPDGYFVIRTPSNRNLLFFRFFIEGGNVDAALESARRDFNIYPLALAGKAPPVRIVYMTGKQYNTIFSNDFRYFEELNRVVQNEPAGLFDPQLYGTFAAIGIRKGQPFEPDARTRCAARLRAVAALAEPAVLRLERELGLHGGRRPVARRPDALVLQPDRPLGVDGHATGRGGLGLPLPRTRRERRLPGWQQELQHHPARPGPRPQLLGLHPVRHPDPLPARDRPALRRHRQQPGRPHPQPGWQLHRLVRPETARRTRGQLGADMARPRLLPRLMDRRPPLYAAIAAFAKRN